MTAAANSVNQPLAGKSQDEDRNAVSDYPAAKIGPEIGKFTDNHHEAMIYWDLMKVKFLILLVILSILANLWLGLPRIFTRQVPDEFLIAALRKTEREVSLRAVSKDFDKDGKLLGESNFILSGEDWEMGVMVGNQCQSCWRRVGDKMFVLDTGDGKYWKMTASDDVKLTSRIDVRQTSRQLEPLIYDGRVTVRQFGSEPCGDIEICRRYELVDIQDSELTRYLWIGQESQLVRREQYVLGNGQTSITDYDGFSKVFVKVPEKVKDSPVASDPMTLPGVVRLP